MAKESQIWSNLEFLQDTNPVSTFRRQREYLDGLLDKENVQNPEDRMKVYKHFNLEREPGDFNREDTTTGFITRALRGGVEGGKQIVYGGMARLASEMDSPGMYKSAQEGLREAQRRQGEIQAVQQRYIDSDLEQFTSDIIQSIPVMAGALGGSYLGAKTLMLTGIPTAIASIGGYSLVDVLLESSATFADVLTNPRMIKAIENETGRKVTDRDLLNINSKVATIMREKGGSAANETAIKNLFNPLNIIESRAKLFGLDKVLGKGGFARRSFTRAGMEGGEETYQGIVQQQARERAIGEVDPSQARDLDLGEALYEGAIGAVAGPVITAIPNYRGARQERFDAERAAREAERLKELETERQGVKEQVEGFLRTEDFASIDGVFQDKDESFKDIIRETVDEARKSDDPKMASAARKYKPGTHMEPETERTTEGQVDLSDIRDPIVKEEYREAININNPTEFHKHIIRVVERTPKIGGTQLLKSWELYKKYQAMKGRPVKDADPPPETTQPRKETTSQPQPQSQPQSQPQPTVDPAPAAQQKATPETEEPTVSPEGLLSKKEAEASIKGMLKELLGENIKRGAGERLVNRGGKTVREELNVEKAFNIEINSVFPTEGSAIRMVPGQGKRTKGRDVSEKLYTPDVVRNVALDAAIKLRDQGKINAEELELIRQSFDGVEFKPPVQPTTTPDLVDTTAPAPGIEAALVNSGIDPASFQQTITRPVAKVVLTNAGYSDAEAEALIPNKEIFTVQDLIDSERTQGVSEETAPQDDIPPELSKEFLSSGLARKAVLEYITTGNPSLNAQVTEHVKEQMRKEAKKPEGESEIDLKALTNSQIVDNYVNIHRTRMMEEYLEAVRGTGEVQDNYYPQSYFNTGTIRNVFNAMYDPRGSAIGLKGEGIKDSEYNSNKDARMAFMTERVKDPKFKGPKSLNKAYLDKLKTQVAKDDRGRAVVSDEDVIMRAGEIPEGAVIQRITKGRKKNTVTFFQFTGMDAKEGDLEPGMWVAVASRGGQWTRITKPDREGETTASDVPAEMRPELFQEMHRVNPDDKQGLNMANAYLQLMEEGETNVNVGDSMYSIEGGGKFTVPEPEGTGYSGPLTDSEKEMSRRYKENIKTRRKFDQAREAIASNDIGPDSTIDRLQKEITRYYDMKGLPLGRDAVTFGSNTVDIVTSEANVNDPIFQEGIDFFQFKELERGPYQSPTGQPSEGLVMVKFGPPAKVEKPRFEERKPSAPEEEKFDGDLYGRWMNGKWVIMGGIARANVPGQGDTLMYDPDKIDQVPDQYKALFTNFKKAKSSDKGPGKIVADAPKWMKDEIENGRGLLSKEAMIRTVNMGVIPELSLPEHLRANENDTEAMTNAKRKINEALWESTSEQHVVSIGKGADNKEKSSLQNRAPITALYAALTALSNPNTANAALATHLGVKSAAQNRQMDTEEMRDEIQRLEELQQTLPELQQAVTEALNELADAQTDAIQIQDLLKIMEGNLDDKIQDAGEALATGQIDYPEFINRVNTAKKNFSNQGEGFLNKIDQADAEKTVEEKKAQAADLLKQLEDITVNLESLRAQYQRAQDQAVEEATKNSVAPAPDDPVETLKDTYGLQDTDEIDSDTVKDQELVTMNAAAKSFQQAIYSLMKGRTGDKAPKGVPKPNDLIPVLQNYYASTEGKPKLIGFKRKSHKGKPGVYVQPLLSGQTPKQWVLNLANTWINENTQTPLTEAEFKMTQDFNPEDILGADYKDPSENQGRDDFMMNKIISLSDLGGRYKLNEKQVAEIDRALDEADFPFYADGFDLQSIVNSDEFSWEKPANWKEAGDDSVYKAIRQAVDSNIIPQSKKDAIADGMFNDIKQMLRLYLNGVASYGYTNNTGFEENQTALDIGAITREEYGKIDSTAIRADKELGKKKL